MAVNPNFPGKPPRGKGMTHSEQDRIAVLEGKASAVIPVLESYDLEPYFLDESTSNNPRGLLAYRIKHKGIPCTAAFIGKAHPFLLGMRLKAWRGLSTQLEITSSSVSHFDNAIGLFLQLVEIEVEEEKSAGNELIG